MKEIKLSDGELNKEYVIAKVLVEDSGLKFKLEKLGIFEKSKVEILCYNFGRVSYMIKAYGVIYGVDKKICEKVVVYDY